MVGLIQRTLEGLMNRFQLRYLGLNHGSIHPVAFPQKPLELGKLPLEFPADCHSFRTFFPRHLSINRRIQNPRPVHQLGSTWLVVTLWQPQSLQFLLKLPATDADLILYFHAVPP